MLLWGCEWCTIHVYIIFSMYRVVEGLCQGIMICHPLFRSWWSDIIVSWEELLVWSKMKENRPFCVRPLSHYSSIQVLRSQDLDQINGLCNSLMRTTAHCKYRSRLGCQCQRSKHILLRVNQIAPLLRSKLARFGTGMINIELRRICTVIDIFRVSALSARHQYSRFPQL